MRKILCTALAACMLIPMLLTGCQKQEAGITVLDGAGNTMLRIEKSTNLHADARGAYLEIVLSETAQRLAEKEGAEAAQILETLLDRSLTVHTAFDGSVLSAITQAEEIAGSELDIGCAVTDLTGKLIAAYSSSEETNYATAQTAPYSAFKPLSVYLPAIASGNVNWFTFYEDSPYKQLPNEEGTPEDWPRNSTGTYSYEQEPVYIALRRSLNTVAVKCLAQVGVNQSIGFLQDSFGIPLVQEAQVAKTLGEEEVIGNIALGYLETGVSPVDMAGYYQIFGNGGVYTRPQAVTKITDGGGRVLYEVQYERKQVTTAAAADVMNRLLQGVVGVDGTGTAAVCEGVQVAGKTGTGDKNSGNWFVGLIPGYSCAIWHGKAESNTADDMFGAVMQTVFDSSGKQLSEFEEHAVLGQVVCCAESGMPVGNGCRTIELAYFITDYVGQPCNIHEKK